MIKLSELLEEYLNENIMNDIIYYHGSPYKFDNLKKDVGKKTGGDEYGYGIYLTNNKNLATHYAKGGYVYNVKIPNRLNFLSDNKKVSKSNLDKVRNMFSINNDIVDNKGERMSNEQKLFIINNIIKDSKNGIDLYNKILRIFPISDKQLSEMMDDIGINGIIGNGEKEIVIFNPLNTKILSIKALQEDWVMNNYEQYRKSIGWEKYVK